MELLLITGIGGDPALDTASVPIGIEPGTVHLEFHTPSQPKPHLLQVKTTDRTYHRIRNVSNRHITEHLPTHVPVNHTDRHRTIQHPLPEIHLFPTDRLSRHTHVQHSCLPYTGRRVGGPGC